ncbi:hypothetical protein [Staphylococcus equorum]|uniref:hypothetical protein n=1 Tax=Staphylococcus equorum TaxID=246432 RepID=UPI00114D455F|nr:hypothetical protein [Staphylococcus equorum]
MMSQKLCYKDIVHSAVASQMIPNQQKLLLEDALIRSIDKRKLIRPQIYKRRFNIPINIVIQVMNGLTKEGLLTLKFEINIINVDHNKIYKYGKIPPTIFDENIDDEVSVNLNNDVSPIYEVVTYD